MNRTERPQASSLEMVELPSAQNKRNRNNNINFLRAVEQNNVGACRDMLQNTTLVASGHCKEKKEIPLTVFYDALLIAVRNNNLEMVLFLKNHYYHYRENIAYFYRDLCSREKIDLLADALSNSTPEIFKLLYNDQYMPRRYALFSVAVNRNNILLAKMIALQIDPALKKAFDEKKLSTCDRLGTYKRTTNACIYLKIAAKEDKPEALKRLVKAITYVNEDDIDLIKHEIAEARAYLTSQPKFNSFKALKQAAEENNPLANFELTLFLQSKNNPQAETYKKRCEEQRIFADWLKESGPNRKENSGSVDDDLKTPLLGL